MREQLFNWQTYAGPESLPGYSLEELQVLCADLRRQIIEVTQANGGHLGANLGVIELTVALLRTWDCQRTPVVFDVGHQSYAYKILTGRRESFATLRKQGGLSGFPKREESPYDAFNTGHSSTSISAALGLARAARAQGEERPAIAIIGDGAMTGGLAWEALNNIGPDDPLLLIVNDNGMSIAPNVGRLHNHLEQIRIHPKYLRAKPWLQNRLSRIPILGDLIVRGLRCMKTRTRRAMQTPRDTIFESLGLRYYGPVDGHDLQDLLRHLEALKRVRGPRVLHIHTQKGRGYAPAEQDPAEYHGVSPQYQNRIQQSSPFPIRKQEPGQNPERERAAQVLQAEQEIQFVQDDRRALPASAVVSEQASTSNVSSLSKLSAPKKPSSFTDAFAQSLLELAVSNPRIHAITAAMPGGTGLDRFAERFPNRFSDVGIAEAHALCFAAGMAAGGMRPVVALYSTFLQRAYDQLIHDCCLQKLPVTIALDRAGLVGADGETHQGCYDLAALLPLPNLYLLAPATYAELQQCLKQAVDADEGPWVIRYPKGAESPESEADPLPIRKDGIFQPVILQPGRDATLVVVGPLRKMAREAIAALEKHGFSVQLVAPGLLKPLPLEAIRSCLCPHKPLIVIEEGVEIGSWGNDLIRRLNWDAPARSLGLPDRPIEQASVEESRASCGLTAAALADTLKRLLED